MDDEETEGELKCESCGGETVLKVIRDEVYLKCEDCGHLTK